MSAVVHCGLLAVLQTRVGCGRVDQAMEYSPGREPRGDYKADWPTGQDYKENWATGTGRLQQAAFSSKDASVGLWSLHNAQTGTDKT